MTCTKCHTQTDSHKPWCQDQFCILLFKIVVDENKIKSIGGVSSIFGPTAEIIFNEAKVILKKGYWTDISDPFLPEISTKFGFLLWDTTPCFENMTPELYELYLEQKNHVS